MFIENENPLLLSAYEEFIEEKLSKHENFLTKLLRKLLKQKDEKIQQVKNENDQLKDLILKQQELINKLNNENIKLATVLKNNKTKIS